MSVFWTILIVLALAALGYILGRQKALNSVGGDSRRMHSLPRYYGWNVAIFTMVPAFLVLIAWMFAQAEYVERHVTSMIEPADIGEGSNLSLVMADVRRLASGLETAIGTGAMTADQVMALDASKDDIRGMLGKVGVAFGSDVTPHILAASQSYREIVSAASVYRAIAVLAVALIGFAYAYAQTNGSFWARNRVEQVTLGLLILCSMIAIATTVGIILSMVFETGHFFGQYSWTEFFFGTTWSPNFHGNSQLGMLPLLWGTLYVSAIALAVAVPIGLFAAIYMSEYASPRFRSIAKPAIEVLAGIPTIVYGLFALITVGPLLRDWLAQPLGLGNSGSSVMTAGLVMGVMIIPFVSSLSDDIINAVPQSLRDGSLGLGATPSETIRQVVLPAALPGIVGAVLLAASRAIGETMIVVLGAGAAAKLSLNPFEAMTTITVKIVSQLTGDTDFAAPETLVAFALGLTLFVITLGLNILALYIVRKYREQYE